MAPALGLLAPSTATDAFPQLETRLVSILAAIESTAALTEPATTTTTTTMTAMIYQAVRRLSAWLLLLLVFSTHSDASSAPQSYDDGSAILNRGLASTPFRRLGQYSPRFAVSPADYRTPLPDHCETVQLHSLERHGARHLTKSALKSASATLVKLQSSIRAVQDLSRLLPEHRFVKDASLANASDSLIPYGALQAWYSGRSAATRFPVLAKAVPFARSTGDLDGSDRVILTAQYWLAGFHGQDVPFHSAPLDTSDAVRTFARASLPLPDVIFSEHDGQNNTLHVDTCPAADALTGPDTEDGAQALFTNSTLLDTVGRRLDDRLRTAGVRNLTLSGTDLVNLSNLCAFETLIDAELLPGYRVRHRPSGFCSLFRDDDWEALGYVYDVGKYYGAGYGNPYHRALGQGYLRELRARLTNTAPVLDPPTSLNTTVDGDPALFPVDDGRIYLDTSHDNEIGPMVAALGLFDGPRLSTARDAQLRPRAWRFSHIAPFGGKIEIEKVRCRARAPHAEQQQQGGGARSEYVRIRANGQLLSTDRSWCPAPPSSRRRRHAFLCPLDAFVDRLTFVQTDDEWQKCYI
ncbi:uncharacterized protein PFL1_04900 [Pseudozyma flocculosa PF-1]|uniref:Phosphoglycerate mutase-like protein n=2 Tax=Pseudozyma flocculosa TaxID=84751 RepID=A0A5C3EVD8_9BASI|nr:uncharacterized protein PFL1_04900 [Pseudozyma flocculosa PF-1]EPQ27361.1 hypothetical protein PFL1_04900 [Pseudozyma flocculosa PF-1]SPO36224.1 uncharacterized protein PSFLO_01695 [Pseudozyma flocculosa]